MPSILSVLIVALLASFSDAECEFPAIFSFGDSISDTGGFSAAFPRDPLPPHGMTYFKKSAGRVSDGRLVIDFLAQGLGLPFLSPYIQSIGSNFSHGANFATGGSTVLPRENYPFVSWISPFPLAVQVNQMKGFRARVLEMKSQANYLPPKDIFGNALYVINIGFNDFIANLETIGVQGVKQYLPQVAIGIAEAIREIYELGGRTFMVFNVVPVGCYPSSLTVLPHDCSELDIYGCMPSYNEAVVGYNKMLHDALRRIRDELPGASVIYVDFYSVLLRLFQHPKDHGFEYGTKACCGAGDGAYNFNPEVLCGNSKVIDGRNITASACEDPGKHVSWDGYHLTEAANKVVAVAVMDGSYSEPHFALSKLCDSKPISWM